MIGVQLHPDEFKAAVTVDGNLFTEYRYGHFVCKPYLYPVLTPDGQRLTRGYPAEKFEGETDDHYWHRSIYVCHGLVNGCNLWDEHLDHGAMLQRGQPAVGIVDNSAEIDGIVDWFGPEGQRLLEERRTIAIRAHGPLRILDHRSEFRARYGEVVFGDTKEGGLLAIRVASSMDAAQGGRIANSEGLVYEGKGEEETWGKAAQWVDYSGPVANGDHWGITVVDHRSNPRHPSHWHVRGYGLFTANPFGLHDFTGDDEVDGSLTIDSGGAEVFRYRLIIHPGRGIDTNPQIEELIRGFHAA